MPAMVDITITLLSGDKLGRRIREADATDAGPFALFDRAVAVGTAIERDCEQEVTSIDIQPSRIRGSETQHQQRWSNVCGKVQHTKGCDCRAAFTLVTFCITGAGLRSDGKKPSLLAQRYPRATSCLGMCEDGLTELGCDRK